MNFFHHKGLGNHLLQLCPKVVKYPVYFYYVTQWMASIKFIAPLILTSVLHRVELSLSCSGHFTLGKVLLVPTE